MKYLSLLFASNLAFASPVGSEFAGYKLGDNIPLYGFEPNPYNYTLLSRPGLFMGYPGTILLHRCGYKIDEISFIIELKYLLKSDVISEVISAHLLGGWENESTRIEGFWIFHKEFRTRLINFTTINNSYEALYIQEKTDDPCMYGI